MENEYDQMDEVVSLVQEHMGWSLDKALLWLDTPNPIFGNVPPMQMIQIGRGEKVLKFVRNAINENTSC
jgi:hypothetical protein